MFGMTYLRVKGWVLNHAVDEDGQVILDHEGLHIGLLALVHLLRKRPARITTVPSVMGFHLICKRTDVASHSLLTAPVLSMCVMKPIESLVIVHH